MNLRSYKPFSSPGLVWYVSHFTCFRDRVLLLVSNAKFNLTFFSRSLAKVYLAHLRQLWYHNE